MLTPAQRHFQTVMAQRHGKSNGGDVERTAYEQQLHRLRMDKSRLSQVQSASTKAELKRELLPDYQGWVNGVLAADSGQADEVLTTIMIWSIDAGLTSDALRIADYVLRHRLPMPDQYKRTVATTLVDEICDPALAAFKADTSRAPLPAALLLQLEQLTAGEDMPDQVRAKLYKTLGYTLRLDNNELSAARDWLQRAVTLFDGIGVKRDIELLGRALKKSTESEAGAENADAPPTPPADKPADKPAAKATRAQRKSTAAKASRTTTPRARKSAQ
ncbi:phage terminase small subunit [Pectobacterium carotovorum]|uniref:phage terminase small subunit n=1 Tax=Pectobacterium carotovorum TaxID=554 RepID=UPI00057F2A50|nr:phage terminase small subunit [Pectobacterium carotovorum]KHT34446.1 terminase [Pectobacterium carotovorum subsp. carotovorum]